MLLCLLALCQRRPCHVRDVASVLRTYTVRWLQVHNYYLIKAYAVMNVDDPTFTAVAMQPDASLCKTLMLLSSDGRYSSQGG